MKFFKRLLSATLATVMVLSSVTFSSISVSAAPSVSAGWNETLYAEWSDSNPDSDSVQVGYKLSTDADYTYLTGDDKQFLIRKASTNGYGRVDIPGLTAGRYDIKITASDGAVHERKGIQVYAYDRDGYAHFQYTEGIGGYKDDGTLKDNAIVIYVTDENKDTVTIPGYENTVWNYTSSSTGATWTRESMGIGNILNNNMKFIYDVTSTNNHPLVIRLVGKVTLPKNLTPYNVKDTALGGSKGDNGGLAICKYGKNITVEGIGEDAVMDGWGLTFSQTSTCPADAGRSFEVRNLTFQNYPEDALGFQGDDGTSDTSAIQRVWVHNNTFYPGYCANPAESDKAEGDGSCDFKRGRYYTMSYNKYVDCHKTNLVGSGTSDDQYNISLHHNWYQNVASRQPLAANGNMHIYSTYFENGTSTTVDLRGKNAVLLEENYYQNCKSTHKQRNATCIAKSYNEIGVESGKTELKGKRTVVSSLSEAVLTGTSYTFPDGKSIDNFDLDSSLFYKGQYTATPAAQVPEFVQTYAGTLKAFPVTESATVSITVKTGSTPITDATVTASGLAFKHTGNGVYTATASVGSEYKVTVSKEGYSNVTIDVPAQEDGQTFTANANMVVDTDGYAVVKLVGGTTNAAVKGATVKLADGTVLADQNDGTYKSANQIAVGSYKVTITNTGDYIAPTTAQDITVKSTDAATEIHLDMVQGDVSVTLTKDAEETKEFTGTGASVYVGTTQLTEAGNGVYTGKVDINTPLPVSVNLKLWNVVSITPETLTASKTGTASATVVMKAMGDAFTWNYTDGTNTDDMFEIGGTPSEWKDASKNPLTYNDLTLTKAIKLNSKTSFTFYAPADGDVVVVLNDGGKTNSTIDVNGTDYNVTTGANKISVPAGSVTIAKGKNETRVYLIQFVSGGTNIDPTPTPSSSTTTTEASTQATTESTTEVSTNAIPVELGDPVHNNGEAGISVVYNDATDTWALTDSSTELAAELDIPLKTAVTSGKVIVKGTATPSTNSSKWALLSVKGEKADGTTGEIAALATDSNKNITLRADGTTYATSSTAVGANTTYNYEFLIDLDAKTVELKINGVSYAGSTTATSVSNISAVTSKSGARNLTISNPYVAIPSNDGPVDEDVLNDEIMWNVEADFDAAGSDGLTSGETFFSNMEESAPVQFTYGGKTYEREYWLQGRTDPKDVNGRNPMSNKDANGNTITPTGIPVTGAFMNFAPTQDGALTLAVKTNAGKITYITDNNGKVIAQVDGSEATRYDIVRVNVKAGSTYNIFAGGSKTCLYYVGYTAGKKVTENFAPNEDTTESSTEASTESSTEATTESSTNATTESSTEDSTESSTEASTESSTEATTTDDVVLGDIDGNGSVARTDLVSFAKYFAGAVADIITKNADLNGDGQVTRSDLVQLAKYFAGAISGFGA